MSKIINRRDIVKGSAALALGLMMGNSHELHSEEIKSGKVTMLNVYDNYQFNHDLTTDWGFGCVVRIPEKTILFDTGEKSSILLSNMKKMNIDPKEIDIVVISHIHSDHSGGLMGFLEKNKNVKVYIPASFPDSLRKKIRSSGTEYQDVKDTVKISENIYTTGEMETQRKELKEQSLVINTEEGIIVINGCAHPGWVNIAKKAMQIVPGKNICLFMGGSHLKPASDPEIRSVVKEFRALGVQKVAPSHCSGNRCRELFREEYKEDYIESGVGKIIRR